MRIVLKDRVIETNHIKLEGNAIYVYMHNTTFVITMDSEGIASRKMLELGAKGFINCVSDLYEEVY